MPLQKESVTFNFDQGVDTFVDPNQLPIGKFDSLQNCVFVQAGGQGSLNKRNGYQNLTSIDSQSSYLATYSNGLVSVSNTQFKSYSPTLNSWPSIAPVTPLQLHVNPLIRNAYSQTAFDLNISGGLVCVAYLENASFGSGSAGVRQRYAVIDINTGQALLGPTTITSTMGTVSQTSISRVFSIGSQFAIFTGVPVTSSGSFIIGSSTFGAIQYLSVNQNTLAVTSPTIVTKKYSTQTTGTASQFNGFDGVVSSNTLFLSWYAGSASGKSGIMATSFNTSLAQGTTTSVTQSNGAVSCLSLCSDNVGPSPSRLWNTYISWDGTNSALTNVGTAVTDYSLNLISSCNFFNQSVVFLLADGYSNLASFAVNGTMTFFLGTTNKFGTPTQRRLESVYQLKTGLNFVDYTITVPAQPQVSNLGLGSKPVVIGSDSYWVATFNSTYQSTYFLMNSASAIISKFSNGNGGGFYNSDVPQIQAIGSSLFIGYLNKESISNVNKATNVSSQTQLAGVYAQTGINLGTFSFTANGISSIETANNLHLSGGQLYHFDSQGLDELNFNMYPDFVDINVSNTSLLGRMTPQSYFYSAVYEYTDNKGNIFRSAPSIPVNATIASGHAVAIVYVPTYQATLKNKTLIRVTIYRWSAGQQVYYQTTSQTNPLTNTDNYGNLLNYISFVDTNSDADILGNNIIYTNGGVVEDDGPPASSALTMFDDRMWLIDAEDQNLLWFSKQIIEGTPVEFSGLLTYFVPPTTATGAPTGPVRSFAPMDDKLILFKEQTIYYIGGSGPDNTGANNQYSPTPIFVTSGVGCSNQSSVVLTPMGLMFQSGSKGIWLLKRDLSVQYVGKDVISYATANVLSACLIPNTNHVKFTLDSGITLLFDYLVGQWGVDTLNGQSATIYNGLHTFLNNTGSVYQENPGSYLDGTQAVVMQFQTGFLNPSGLQGYQRTYKAYVLGNYISGNTYTLGIAYDFNSSVLQTATITPTNTIGSGSQVEQWVVNFQRQQCQSFQLTFNEVSSGTAGAGLSLSGINLVYGRKKTFPRNIGPGNRTS